MWLGVVVVYDMVWHVVSRTVDDALKRENQRKLDEAEERLIEIKKEIDALAAEERAIRDEFQAIKAERVRFSVLPHSSLAVVVDNVADLRNGLSGMRNRNVMLRGGRRWSRRGRRSRGRRFRSVCSRIVLAAQKLFSDVLFLWP